jgi:hypothetical protein
MVKVFELLFGCRHKRITRPITVIRRPVTKTKSDGAYVACLDCGRQFHYDLDNMRMGAQIAKIPPQPSSETLQTQY